MSLAIPAALSIGSSLLNASTTAAEKLLTSKASANGANKKAGAMKQAQDFEAVFLNSMISKMFEGVKGDGPMGGSDNAQSTWRSMLVDQYSQNIAQNGGIGLADQISKDILALQEIK